MGCASSSNAGTVINPNPKLPEYYGPKVEYRFVNNEVSISAKMFAFSQGDQLSSSDIDAHYPHLSAPMAEGYHMVCYRNIPGMVENQFMSTTSKLIYQAIYMRKESEPPNSYLLLIERSTIQATQIRHGVFGNVSTEVRGNSDHLLATIIKHAQNGGRLVSICASGNTVSAGNMNHYRGVGPVCGIDLFFEIPKEPRGKYVYQTIPVPIHISMSVQAFKNPETVTNCDWLGNFRGPLSQGWKMVNIFFDLSSSMNMQQGMLSASAGININTIWFFEKPEERINDNTPRYEGTMVDFLYEISIKGLSSIKSTISWEGTIRDMGQQGWELVCIVDSPGLAAGGGVFNKPVLKLMMFFQREIQYNQQ